MTDDELLKMAGEAAREDDLLEDARWDKLPEGSLSELDRAELRAIAERSPDARVAHEALRPLDEAEREQLVDGILAGLGAPAAASLEEAPEGGSLAGKAAKSAGEGPSPAGGAKVIPFARRPRRTVGMLVAAISIAAAAAAAFVALPRGGSSLPGYEVSLLGEQAQRSKDDGGGVVRIGPGSRLHLVLRPVIAVEGTIAARGFLLRDGVTRAWDAPIEIAEGGAIRIAGSYEALFAGAPPGTCELLVAVGRPGTLPSTPEAVAAAREGRVGSQDEAWHLVRVPLLLVDRARPPAP